MSNLLTWASTGNSTKTSTTGTALLNDLDTIITSKSGDATFFWQKAGKVNTGTVQYLLLSRKDGSAGRIAIIIFVTTPPTNIQPVLFDQIPAVNTPYIAWFPSGTGTTLSNLNATSGTVCGVDTNALKAAAITDTSSSYAANVRSFVFDSSEAMYFGFGNPASGAPWMMGAGLLIEDAAGTAYDAVLSSGNGLANSFGAASTSMMPWTPVSSLSPAGIVSAMMWTNYLGSNKAMYTASSPSAQWAATVHSSSDDPMSDDANSKVWFGPYPLMSTVKGEGIKTKLRQVGYGTGQTSPFFAYNTTGPVVEARQFNNLTAGGSGYPWMTNFKIV